MSVLSFNGYEPPPVLPETVWFKLCGHDWRVQHGVVSFFGFSWWNVADGLRKLAVVESADPFEGGEPHGFEVATVLVEIRPDDYVSPIHLMSAYRSLGRVLDTENWARLGLLRAERALNLNPENSGR